MNPFKKYRDVLSTLSWVFDGDVEIKPASVEVFDLSPLRQGKYACASEQCARVDLRVIYLSRPREAYCLSTTTRIGYIKDFRRSGDVIHCLIDWADESGKSVPESIQLHLLAPSSFRLIDSFGAENLYFFEEGPELFMDEEDIEEFIRDTLSDDLLHTFGNEDGADIGLCPYVSFYVAHATEDFLALADKMIGIYAAFFRLIDEPFQLVWADGTREWLPADDERLPSLEYLPALARSRHESGEEFWLRASDQESPAFSPRWAISAEVRDSATRYSTLKLTFRRKWYKQNQTRWQQFVKDCIVQLQPEYCYSGFEVGNGGFDTGCGYECDVMERICADYFYGMDVDHVGHASRMTSDEHSTPVASVRAPTWCFLLTPFVLAALGKTEADVRAELEDSLVEIAAIPFATGPRNPAGAPALWVRLGELDLHPIENGVPELLVKANRLIEAIRCEEFALLANDLDAYFDPNPRFDDETALRWMRRFDEDSFWPDPVRRK